MDPIPPQSERPDMDAFRRDIEALKRTDSDIHLRGLDTSALTEFDAHTWERYTAGTLTIPEFNERRHEAVGKLSTDHPRTLFYAHIGNDWYDRHGAPQI